jgi:hypothetical protein
MRCSSLPKTIISCYYFICPLNKCILWLWAAEDGRCQSTWWTIRYLGFFYPRVIWLFGAPKEVIRLLIKLTGKHSLSIYEIFLFALAGYYVLQRYTTWLAGFVVGTEMPPFVQNPRSTWCVRRSWLSRVDEKPPSTPPQIGCHGLSLLSSWRAEQDPLSFNAEQLFKYDLFPTPKCSKFWLKKILKTTLLSWEHWKLGLTV